MLERSPISTQRRGAVAPPTGEVRLGSIIQLLRSRTRLITGWAVFVVLLAALYLTVATPLYSASAQMVFSQGRVKIFDQKVTPDETLDSTQVDSQVEVIRSDAIANAVVDKLRLLEARGPSDEVEGWFNLHKLMEMIVGPSDEVAPDERRNIVKELQGNTTVRRIAGTNVVEVSYRSPDPVQSAQIANAIAAAYIDYQVSERADAARRASEWLQVRLSELKTQVATASRAVQDFRNTNNLIDAGNRGRLTDQRLTELNTQLGTARAQVAEANARLNKIQEVLDGKAAPDAAISDALRSEIIIRLRQQYTDATVREADFVQRYGASHAATQRLRDDIQGIRRAMLNELRRLSDVSRGEYEIAKAREASLVQSMTELTRQAQVEGQANVGLQELESNSQAYRAIFDSFLQKYTEAVQQQSFPDSEARIITPAYPSNRKSYPQTKLVLLLAAILGLGAGISNVVILRVLDRSIRTPEQLEDLLGIECVALVPAVRNARNLQSYAMRQPLSLFAESLRSIRTSIMLGSKQSDGQAVAIVSALPNEGKSTLAVNLGHQIASSGKRALLIDADLRNPSLSRTLAPKAQFGLLDVLEGRAELARSILQLDGSGLHFLPAAVRRDVSASSDILASQQMSRLVEALRKNYDIILIDLAPLGPVVDARAAAHLLDTIFLVAEWGVTSEDVLVRALSQFESVGKAIHAAILNKVEHTALVDYQGSGAEYYASDKFKDYVRQ
jgi:polysaccharide biosynthesis transport protein